MCGVVILFVGCGGVVVVMFLMFVSEVFFDVGVIVF